MLSRRATRLLGVVITLVVVIASGRFTLPVAQGATRATAAAVPGYWLTGGDGSVYGFGGAGTFGSLAGQRLNTPIAGMAPTPSGGGYWLVGTDGGVFSFGDAKFFGSTGNIKLNKPIVGMAPTPTGQGYWFVASDGGVFAFGDAGFYGSTGNITLNKPIVGMAPTPTGQGYWFVASDGGVFAFGDAGFYGSTGAFKLNRPIVGMAPMPTGKGYWFVATDGGIFAFGDAGFHGSAGDMKLSHPIAGMAATPSGQGYWFVASDGGVFNFGDAANLAGRDGGGSAAGKPLGGFVAAIATIPPAPGPPPQGNSPSSAPPTTTTTAAPPYPTTTTTVAPGPTPAAPFEIGLVGDTGYFPVQEKQFARAMADMNSRPLAFVVHDGDIRNQPMAETPCIDEDHAKALALFNTSTAPLIYTPGDNEWSDCTEPSERLGHLRSVFYPDANSLGQRRIPLTRQAAAGRPYTENARWVQGGVVFVTINAVGVFDNRMNRGEFNPRRAANLAWLQAAFDLAQATNAPGVMVIEQANPFEGPTSSATPEPVQNPEVFTQIRNALHQHAKAFGKPVVLVHGDTHTHRIDQPFGDLGNFTRVETWALSDSDHWVRAVVNPADPKVFSFFTENAGN